MSIPGEASVSPDPDAIAEQLAEAGYCIVPDFLAGQLALALVDECNVLWKLGKYRKAAVGRGRGRKLRQEIRSDFVHWLEPERLSPAQSLYWDRMESLRLALNRRLFLGLFDFEAHLACYPPGAFYKPHLDQHQQTRSRVLSAVVYLNPEWVPDDGGILRLYTEPRLGIDGPWVDVQPEIGKLALFLSGDFWHEVLPATRERYSITGWFRRREEPLPVVTEFPA